MHVYTAARYLAGEGAPLVGNQEPRLDVGVAPEEPGRQRRGRIHNTPDMEAAAERLS